MVSSIACHRYLLHSTAPKELEEGSSFFRYESVELTLVLPLSDSLGMYCRYCIHLYVTLDECSD